MPAQFSLIHMRIRLDLQELHYIGSLMIFHIPVLAPSFVSQQRQAIYPGLPRCADSTSCESAVQAAGRSMRTSHILPHRSLSLSHWERASVVGSATSSIQDTVCLELDMRSRTGAFFANLTRQILSRIPLSDVRTGTAAAFAISCAVIFSAGFVNLLTDFPIGRHHCGVYCCAQTALCRHNGMAD